MNRLDAAIDYLVRGFSIIPLKGKKPLIKWQEYQTRQSTEQEVREWFTGTSNNIGIVTGKTSGITVVDFDTPEAIAHAQEMGFPVAPLVKTGKGFHAYCKYEPGHRNFQTRADLPGIDLRAEGGYVVAPPSVHESGQVYSWVRTLDDADLAPVPDWIIATKPEEKQPLTELYTGTDTGGRNNALTRLVGSWLNDGGTLEEVTAQARLWNAANTPPLSAAELITTVQSIHKGHIAKNEAPIVITDTRVAEHFAANSAHLVRYWAESRKWLTFDGQRWNTDTPGGAFPYLKQMISGLYESARKINDDNLRQETLKNIIKLEAHRRQETILAAASVVPDMIVNSYQLDSDPMQLNVRNGTLDLHTGQLNSHRPENFITRLVNIDYDLNATCPEFDRFLDRILAGKQDLIDYLQRFIGYCLTGKTTEQVLLFLYGTGANGKSTLATIIEHLLCDLAAVSDSSLLMQRDNRNASNDLAALRGSRLVKVSEFNDGERLAEATIKTLTGGDRITCRFLYGEFFEYTPQFKVLLLGNYKPKVRGQDLGIWRRIHLLPFNVTIPESERDPMLLKKLTSELPGILAWAVKGCLEWQRIGLKPPAEVRDEVESYRKQEDIFGQWLDECCELGDHHLTSAKELMQSFADFSGWRNLSTTKMGRMLADAGFIKEKSGTVNWRGLALPGQSGQLDPYYVKPLAKKNTREVYRKSPQLSKLSETTPNDPIPLMEVESEEKPIAANLSFLDSQNSSEKEVLKLADDDFIFEGSEQEAI